MKENLEKSGGTIKYNIYDEPELKKASSIKELLRASKQVKNRSKAPKEIFKVGDVVGLVNYASDMHKEALKETPKGTKNTHVGVVTGLKNGVPIISHNIHGKVYHEPYNKLTIGWVGQPKSASTAKYIPQQKQERTNDVVHNLSVNMEIPVDTAQVRKDIEGIYNLESATGKQMPTSKEREHSKNLRRLLGLPHEDKNISRGYAKFKMANLSLDEQKFLGVTPESLDTREGSDKVTAYLYLKNLERLRKHAEANPELNLTENDLRNAAILAHNQGTSILLNLGYNNPYKTPQQEVEKLRELETAQIQDVSSTKFKYVPFDFLKEALYGLKYPEGHPSYIKRVRGYETGGVVSETKNLDELDSFMESIAASQRNSY